MDPAEEWYKLSENEALYRLQSSMQGLSDFEVAVRRKRDGANDIVIDKKSSAISIFFRQFKSVVVALLLISAGISAATGHFTEMIVILSIIAIVILLNFFMEYKATKEIESLIRLVPHYSKVLRNGKILKIHSSDIVLGDILQISRGDIIGADVRLIECESLAVNESALTGESQQVNKRAEIISENTNLAQRTNMVYAGTQVTNGSAKGIVVEIGQNTEFGKISMLIKSIETQTTPLQKRLDKLTTQVALFGTVLAIITFIIGLLYGKEWSTMLIFSLAIIVSGIPESLPTVVAIVLTLGVKRMAKENAIIKRLPAVETLGACSVICTDKTGTLTQNKMVVESIFTYDKEYTVTGQGYSPEGYFLDKTEKIDPLTDPQLSKILTTGLLCNNADIKKANNSWTVDGEATEGSLVALAMKAGLIRTEFQTKHKRVKEFAFDPQRKMMSTINLFENKEIVYSKGAPEYLLDKSDSYLFEGKAIKLTHDVKNRFLNRTADLHH